MRDYRYITETLNFIVYLIPAEIYTPDLGKALEKYRYKELREFTWTFAEREAFIEMMNNENTIILR